ncbi:DUF2147 domain-containing protein [Oharaeibacter diazotrophicus]|uniref:Uncharacterized protein (DUF2147 family) n=1 Tax=Oharaeibacter diazotrophicus TaxID=1920512 RepID=A0A4R6R598_9HYPH|nr:uncharacterized protein (DUF2147 family) [Oharaeibacter diazotrophicus]BBE73846.1 hypothetical protein OHA_1_03463 [Pleomorphomonas sp. SM30]
MRMFVTTAVAAVLLAGPALAAGGVEGVWKTERGSNAEIYGCGKATCIKLIDGPYKGKIIADDLVDDGSGSYSGSLTDPESGKTYSGYASVSGNALKLKGCALKIFCKSQTWTRVK